ncbi:MAG: hypothetical protein R2788_19965 [Saprospiraceae bacterium]
MTIDGNTTAFRNGGGVHITGAGDMEITGGVVSTIWPLPKAAGCGTVQGCHDYLLAQ